MNLYNGQANNYDICTSIQGLDSFGQLEANLRFKITWTRFPGFRAKSQPIYFQDFLIEEKSLFNSVNSVITR